MSLERRYIGLLSIRFSTPLWLYLTFYSPDQTLQKAVNDILNTCGQSNEQAKGSQPAAHVDEKQVVILLSKA